MCETSTEYVLYSAYEDGDNWHEDGEDAIDEALEYDTFPLTIYEGTFKPRRASDYMYQVDFVVDALAENAYDEVGEAAADWLSDVTDEQAVDLGNALRSAVDDWAARHNLQPRFASLVKVKHIKLEQYYWLTEQEGER